MSLLFGSGACAVPLCLSQTKGGQLMCRSHWFSVPTALRLAVSRAFRGWQQGNGTLHGLRDAQATALAAIVPLQLELP